MAHSNEQCCQQEQEPLVILHPVVDLRGANFKKREHSGDPPACSRLAAWVLFAMAELLAAKLSLQNCWYAAN